MSFALVNWKLIESRVGSRHKGSSRVSGAKRKHRESRGWKMRRRLSSMNKTNDNQPRSLTKKFEPILFCWHVLIPSAKLSSLSSDLSSFETTKKGGTKKTEIRLKPSNRLRRKKRKKNWSRTTATDWSRALQPWLSYRTALVQPSDLLIGCVQPCVTDFRHRATMSLDSLFYRQYVSTLIKELVLMSCQLSVTSSFMSLRLTTSWLVVRTLFV